VGQIDRVLPSMSRRKEGKKKTEKYLFDRDSETGDGKKKRKGVRLGLVEPGRVV